MTSIENQVTDAHRELLEKLEAFRARIETPSSNEADVQDAWQVIYETMRRHYEFEERVIFPAIAAAESSLKVALWLFSLTHQHGTQIRELESLVNESIYAAENEEARNKLLARFDNLRKEILNHAMEEDTKLEPLIKQNTTAQQHLRDLLTHKGTRSWA